MSLKLDAYGLTVQFPVLSTLHTVWCCLRSNVRDVSSNRLGDGIRLPAEAETSSVSASFLSD